MLDLNNQCDFSKVETFSKCVFILGVWVLKKRKA